jgi:hypothetical protein
MTTAIDGQRYIAVLQAQRNAALDAVAQCEARIAALVARNAALEHDLAKLRGDSNSPPLPAPDVPDVTQD